MPDPSLSRLEQDLRGAGVEAGAAAGQWRIVALDWPFLFVAIVAGDGNELGMRLRVDSYPALAPAGQPWDLGPDCALPYERWPTGGTAPQVFRAADWSRANGDAPYLACDRAGLKAHPEWASNHPARAWNAGRTIAFYLQEIHFELRGATVPKPAAATEGAA